MIYRVLRGGSLYDTWSLRCSVRGNSTPENWDWFKGFRLVIRGQA